MTKSLLLPVALLFSSSTLFAAPDHPAWWGANAVYRINPQTQAPYAPDDYAIANIGQLKNMMSGAVGYLHDHLPQGAGPLLGLLETWLTPPPPPAPQPDDYAALNSGQLKAVVSRLWDWMYESGYGYPETLYPWTEATDDDDSYSYVNVGQLKLMFSIFNVTADSDGDLMPDLWEARFGMNPSSPADGASDADDDGTTNAEEAQNGTDPMDPAPVISLYAPVSAIIPP